MVDATVVAASDDAADAAVASDDAADDAAADDDESSDDTSVDAVTVAMLIVCQYISPFWLHANSNTSYEAQHTLVSAGKFKLPWYACILYRNSI